VATVQHLPMKTRLFYSAIVLCATVLLMESVVRLVNAVFPLQRPETLKDTYGSLLLSGEWLDGASRFYTYKPGVAKTHGHSFRVNSLGFRGPEFPPKTTRPRVVVMGDSITSGIGIAEADRYTEVAERLVGRQVEIINLSIQGFDGPQYPMLLDRYGALLQPDYVVLGFYINDARTVWQRRYGLKLPSTLYYVLSHSLTFRVLLPYYDSLYRFAHGMPNEDEILRQSFDPQSRQWALFEKSVASVADWTLSHTHHTPTVLLVTDAIEANTEGFYQPSRALFEQARFTWLEAQRERPDKSIYEPVSRWEPHPNAYTHQRLGEALAAWIQKTIVLTGSP